MENMLIANLKEHPRNKEFFDDIESGRWEDFKNSVDTRGVVEPIVVTQDLLVVSGHQRIRACKELGLLEIPCRISFYPECDEKCGKAREDMIIMDLISTNIMQRGVGNVNPMKMAKCIMELERIKGIRHGSAGKVSLGGNNFPLKTTQSDLAIEIGLDDRQLRNYKKLTNLIPELQQMVENGSMKGTVGYKIWAKMTQEEQEKFFNDIGREKIKTLTQKATQDILNEKNNLQIELDKEKNKPIKREIVEVEIDNTDYTLKLKNEKLTKQCDELIRSKESITERLRLTESLSDKYKEDSIEYKKMKDDIEFLTHQKEDIGVQLQSISSIASLVVGIEDILKNKLAPIKYSKALLHLSQDETVIQTLSEILETVESWTYEMKQYIPNKNNYVEVL